MGAVKLDCTIFLIRLLNILKFKHFQGPLKINSKMSKHQICYHWLFRINGKRSVVTMHSDKNTDSRPRRLVLFLVYRHDICTPCWGNSINALKETMPISRSLKYFHLPLEGHLVECMFWLLTDSANKTIVKPHVAAAANTYTSDFPDVKFRVPALIR